MGRKDGAVVILLGFKISRAVGNSSYLLKRLSVVNVGTDLNLKELELL